MNQVKWTIASRNWVKDPVANVDRIASSCEEMHDACQRMFEENMNHEQAVYYNRLRRDLYEVTRRTVFGLLRDVVNKGLAGQTFDLGQFSQLALDLQEGCKVALRNLPDHPAVHREFLNSPTTLGDGEFENCRTFRVLQFKAVPVDPPYSPYDEGVHGNPRESHRDIVAVVVALKLFRPDYLRTVIDGPGSRAEKLRSLNGILARCHLDLRLSGTALDNQEVRVLEAKERLEKELEALEALRRGKKRRRP